MWSMQVVLASLLNLDNKAPRLRFRLLPTADYPNLGMQAGPAFALYAWMSLVLHSNGNLSWMVEQCKNARG